MWSHVLTHVLSLSLSLWRWDSCVHRFLPHRKWLITMIVLSSRVFFSCRNRMILPYSTWRGLWLESQLPGPQAVLQIFQNLATFQGQTKGWQCIVFLVSSSLKWRWYHPKKARGVPFLNGHVTIHTNYQLALQDVSFVLGQWHYPSVPFFERHKVSWCPVLMNLWCLSPDSRACHAMACGTHSICYYWHSFNCWKIVETSRFTNFPPRASLLQDLLPYLSQHHLDLFRYSSWKDAPILNIPSSLQDD